MPLSNKDLADIAKEFSVAKTELGNDKKSLPSIQGQIDEKQAQVTRQYIPYNNSNTERVIPYQLERRWLDGTTYVDITQAQINEAAERTTTSIFYPSTWTKSNAKLTDNGNGNPTSSSPNHESILLNGTVIEQGLISQVNLLRNGQSSGVASHVLTADYVPGDPTIDIDTGTQTVGKYLYISGSGTSALVYVTDAVGTTITITEVIAPAVTIVTGGSVVEAIPGFNNTERQNLTSASYQRILTELTNRIKAAAALWKTALDNQYSQLSINIDNPAQIATAKTNVSNAQTAYNTWFALSDTGASGKFVDTSLDDFTAAYNAKNATIAGRISQIVTALGSVSQDSEGNYSGSGQFLQRFKCMNYLVNSANGAQFQLFSLQGAKKTFENKVANNTDKLATYSNLVRFSSFTADSTGSNSIAIDNVSQFSISDSILLTGNDLPSIGATITNISGSTVQLSINIPVEYNKAAKAGIIKAI